MSPIFTLFTLLLITAVAFAGLAWLAVARLEGEANSARRWRWLLPWLIKGLVLPFLFWAGVNLGVSARFQPFMPQVQAAKNSGANWLQVFTGVAVAGMFMISSCWAALTLAWAAVKTGAELEGQTRSEFRTLCLASVLGLLLPAALLVLLGGWTMIGPAVLVLLLPVAGYAPGVLHKAKPPPLYSRAIARMKLGKYADAEQEIIRELEQCESDFDGWLLLAELYATRFRDLPTAEQTILDLCAQPDITPPQVCIALHKLADWHLKLASDPEGARRTLRLISQRLPGTHLARMAELRAAGLPRTTEELREQREPHRITLPALNDQLDEVALAPPPTVPDAQGTAQAGQLSKHLQQSPDDASGREKLARLLAEHLGQADAAIEHVQTLLKSAGTTDRQRAEWLALIAAWHLRYRRDPQAAREVLQRLEREHPNTPQAFAARRRLNLMDLEDKQPTQRPPPPPRIRVQLE